MLFLAGVVLALLVSVSVMWAEMFANFQRRKHVNLVKRLLALRVYSGFRRTDEAGGGGNDPSRHRGGRNECASSCRTYVGADKTDRRSLVMQMGRIYQGSLDA